MDEKSRETLRINLSNIVEHFGIVNQVNKFKEESSELIQAIIEFEKIFHTTRKGMVDARNHIAEEIADCLVLISQFIDYYNINMFTIEGVYLEKVYRTIQRIKDGYYEKDNTNNN